MGCNFVHSADERVSRDPAPGNGGGRICRYEGNNLAGRRFRRAQLLFDVPENVFALVDATHRVIVRGRDAIRGAVGVVRDNHTRSLGA